MLEKPRLSKIPGQTSVYLGEKSTNKKISTPSHKVSLSAFFLKKAGEKGAGIFAGSFAVSNGNIPEKIER
ncbi:hypothetical protein H8693_07030 [Christensenellaceae bacterium NSJ-63]|uniref:Uncharacterized protein n=1 Tax=Guopingia tenuis TaxID=2763656 RepID=A0A926HXE7_9FIRM|nr:hypothetical protein [Guopingia tenuis]MBC8538686.1 hypothetical protein [Guopingia tenuis]